MQEKSFGTKSTRTGFDLEEMDYCDFMEEIDDTRFIVDGIVVENQHLIIGGPPKSYKTSTLLDLAVSIANKADFLGRFPVLEQKNVLVISGESGRPTIRETCQAIEAAKGITQRTRGAMFFSSTMPTISKAQHLEELERKIEKHSIGFCVLDPVYIDLLAQGKPTYLAKFTLWGPCCVNMGP